MHRLPVNTKSAVSDDAYQCNLDSQDYSCGIMIMLFMNALNQKNYVHTVLKKCLKTLV